MKNFLILSLILLSLSIKAHEYENSDVFVNHPWVKALKTNSLNAVGYMEIENKSNNNIHIIEIKSKYIKEITLHSTFIKNDIMMMRPYKDGIIINKGDILSFKPGSDHLMMKNFENKLSNNDMIEAEIIFKKINPIKIFFKVKLGESVHKH